MSLKQTPLHDYFVNTGCRMAPFAGWEMPIQFSGLINEHTAVREKAGLFDISHMGVFLLEGIGCKDALQNLVPTDLYRIGAGEACYTLLLNENGGIIDDLIIYDLGNNKNTEKILLIINAACTESDIRWIQKNCSKEKISISDFKKNNVLGALQGPKALEILERTFQESLKNIPRFGHKIIRVKTKNLETQNPIFVARTGYTGEDGFEFLLEASLAPKIWAALVKEGVTLCGLGARDTLRLEAAMHLYGHEMTELTTPFDAGLGWLVNLEMTRNFVGREVLEKQMATGGLKKLIGLKIHGKGIARQGYKIFDSKKEIGEITSGSWSPTLNEAIALGYIDKEFGKVGTKIKVDIRGKMHDATIVKRPFYKRKNDF
tara:strand:+ start:565 stop:1686 length:1122 start_codon:yes stop_codon:yes gene_type:complete